MGGLTSSDGRTVKFKRLLRSGELVNLPESDIRDLKERFDLKVIVDFRSVGEVEKVPDDIIEGTIYNNINLHEKQNQKAVPPSQKEFRKLREKQLVIDFMTNVYDRLIKTPFTLNAYSRFIRLLRDNTDGAVLFHCYAGKDRTGVAAAIVYTLLGISEEDILEEFLLTNEFRRQANEILLKKAKEEDPDVTFLEALKISYEVVPEYLLHVFNETKKASGSFIQYIKDNMNVNDYDIETIKNNYLE